MSINYNGASATDGLVFAYDLGNVRSYKGEPTVNQYVNPDFSDGVTGWSFGSWDGNISRTTETVVGPYGKDVSALKLTKNSSSSYSHFHQGNNGKYINGTTYTLSAWVKGSGILRGNTQWGWVHTTFTLTGDWQYVEYTVTSPNSTQYPYWAAELITEGTTLYMTHAQSEAKPYATPYVKGERTTTEGLLDIVGGAPIDLTNVSFNSNAQMVFDNTDDFIEFPPGVMPNFSTNDFAIEVVFKMDYNTSYNHFYTVGDQQHFGLKQNRNNSDYRIYVYRTSTLSTYSNIAIDATPGQTHHLVCQRNGDNIEMYLNGEYKGSKSGWGNIDIEGDTLPTKIGNGWGSEFSNGSQYITKVYNRALTAEEVAQNFNSLKNRFDL